MEGMTELIDEFLQEILELIDAVTDDVLDLEGTHDQDTVNRIFRAIHSAKGNAAMLGFDRMSGFAHEVEDFFSAVRAGKRVMDKATADLVLRCLDELRQGLEVIGDTDEDGHDYIPVLKMAPHNLTANMNPDSEPKRGVATRLVGGTTAESLECLSDKGKLRILVVEDDYLSRKLLVSHFSKIGECHVAKDGMEAIQAVVESFDEDKPRPYDLICMDIMMPVMDGFKAARTIREIERGKGVAKTGDESVIFMTTAVGDKESINKAVYECGANKYFVKPIELSEIQLQFDNLRIRSNALAKAS